MDIRGHAMSLDRRSLAVPIFARAETPPRRAISRFLASDRTDIASFPYRSNIYRDFLSTRKRPRIGTVASSRAGLLLGSRRFRRAEYRYGERTAIGGTRP
jgi:hypothetical protein